MKLSCSSVFSVLFSVVSALNASCTSSINSVKPLQAYVAVDAKSGNILYAKNADCRTQPASLTKIMLLYVTFRELNRGKLKLNTMMRVSHHAAAQKPSSLKLRAGEYISCRNAILAVVTKSANDAAVVLAEHIAGSEARFVRMMNTEARRLKMYSTVFRNASGWKDQRQLTTARDMVKLSKALMQRYPDLFKIFSTQRFRYKNITYANHNKLLGQQSGIKVDGIKTGYVRESGFNISTSAVKGNDRIIVVVLGGKTAKKRDAETKWLIHCAFNKLNAMKIFARKRNSLKKINRTPQKLIARSDKKLPTRGKIRSKVM